MPKCNQTKCCCKPNKVTEHRICTKKNCNPCCKKEHCCKFYVETADSSNGDAAHKMSLKCGDTFRFWSAGGLHVEPKKGSVLMNLEPNNILVNDGSANDILPEGPDDPNRPAFYIDNVTGDLYCWEPKGETGTRSLSRATEPVDSQPPWAKVNSLISPECVGFGGKDIGEDGVCRTTLGVTVTIKRWLKDGGKVIGFEYTVSGGNVAYRVKHAKDTISGTSNPYIGNTDKQISEVLFCITPGPSRNFTCLDWEELLVNIQDTQVISDSLEGITLTTGNSGTNPLNIFDSSNPTSGSEALGTPNQDFSGPGVGSGGNLGATGENNTSHGKVLIIQEETKLDAEPNDVGGYFDFEFDELVYLNEIHLLNIENGQTATMQMYNVAGTLINTINSDALGTNSFEVVALNTDDVKRLRVTFTGKGAIAKLVYSSAVLPQNLNDLGDVTLGGVANKDLLQFNGSTGSTGVWSNVTIDQVLECAALESVGNVNADGATDNELLVKSGSNWTNTTMCNALQHAELNCLGNLSVAGATGNDILINDGTNWTNTTMCDALQHAELNCLGNLSVASAVNNDLLINNGTDWTNNSVCNVVGTVSVGCHSDVTLNSLTVCDTLEYNGSNFVNVQRAFESDANRNSKPCGNSSNSVSGGNSTVLGGTGIMITSANSVASGLGHNIAGLNGFIGGGQHNTINSGATNSAIYGGEHNTISTNVKNTVVLGCTGITATQSNTVYGCNFSVHGTVDMNNNMITNLSDPVNNTDVANKQYVDNVASGLDPKESVRVTTCLDVNGTYGPTGGSAGSGELTGVDLTDSNNFDLGTGPIVLQVNDRVLLKNQTDKKQNGIYIVTVAGASGSLVRAEDQDGNPGSEVSSGNFTFVELGNLYAHTGWVVQGDGTLTLNTDELCWVQFSQSTNIIAGDGLDLSGNLLSVDPKVNGGLVFESAKVAVDLGASNFTGKLNVSNLAQSGAVVNNVLQFNGSNWVTKTPCQIVNNTSIMCHADVSLTSPAFCDYLHYDGSQFINVSLGKGSGTNNTRGGEGAYDGTAGGSDNTAWGVNTLSANTSSNNTAVGSNVLSNLVTGNGNIGLGSGALRLANNTNVEFNVVAGMDAASHSGFAARECVIMGYKAMENAQSNPSQSVAIGPYALQNINSFADHTIAIGDHAMSKVVNPGDANIAIGRNALDSANLSNTVSDTIGIGTRSLQSLTIGKFNTSIGYESMRDTTVGGFNVIVGYRAMYRNVNGSHNVAVGYIAMDNCFAQQNIGIGSFAMRFSRGIGNVGIGYRSSELTTTGYGNVTVGQYAGQQNVSGYENVYMGQYAGRFATTARQNTVLGRSAMERNVSGIRNVALGFRALVNNLSNSNIGIGYNAGSNCTTGNNNTCVGPSSFATLTTGIGNVGIGGGVNVDTSSRSGCTILGNGGVTSAALGDNQLVIATGGSAKLLTNFSTTGTAGAVSTYLQVTINGTNYKIPLHNV